MNYGRNDWIIFALATIQIYLAPLLPVIVWLAGSLAAISLVLFIIMLFIYIVIAYMPIDRILVLSPVLVSELYMIYIAYSMVARDLLIDLLAAVALPIMLLIIRQGLSSRRNNVREPSENPIAILRIALKGFSERLDTILVSLGLSLIAMSLLDLLMILKGVETRPAIIYNPVIVSGAIMSSLANRARHPVSIIAPIASWASFYISYVEAIYWGKRSLISKESRVLRIPEILVERYGELELQLSTSVSPHIIISGSTGSGKTSLCKILAKRLMSEGVGVIIIDYHGEYRDLDSFIVIDASENSPQIIPTQHEEGKTLELVDSLRRIFRLGALQVSMLTSIVEEMIRRGGKSFSDLLLTAEAMLEEYKGDPRSREILLSIIPYLKILSTHIRGKPIDIGSIISGGRPFLIIDMSSIGSEYASTLYAEYLLKQVWSYKVARGHREKVDLVIILDEAHNILRGSAEDFISRIFRESRKYGLSVVIATQQFERLPQEVVNNTNTFFLLRHTDPRVIDRISRLVGDDLWRSSEGERIIRSLKPLHGLLYISDKKIIAKIHPTQGFEDSQPRPRGRDSRL